MFSICCGCCFTPSDCNPVSVLVNGIGVCDVVFFYFFVLKSFLNEYYYHNFYWNFNPKSDQKWIVLQLSLQDCCCCVSEIQDSRFSIRNSGSGIRESRFVVNSCHVMVIIRTWIMRTTLRNIMPLVLLVVVIVWYSWLVIVVVFV